MSIVRCFCRLCLILWLRNLGFGKSKTIERVHPKFCKRLLNVRQNSCNNAIYGELRRFPLNDMRYVKIVNNWLKIVNSDNIFV